MKLLNEVLDLPGGSDKWTARVLVDRARALMRQSHYTAATADLARAAKRTKDKALGGRIRALQGSIQAAGGNFDAAQHAYDEALEAGPRLMFFHPSRLHRTHGHGPDGARPVVPRRIVTIAPNSAEIICALGEADRLVGVSTYCVYPARLRDPLLQVGACGPVRCIGLR